MAAMCRSTWTHSRVPDLRGRRVQEQLYHDPWKLLLACMLLNKTNATKVCALLMLTTTHRAQIAHRVPLLPGLCVHVPGTAW